ncbi:hypothetical protein AB9P05_21855 [Roseivirga sp. BDSF3-8]|uniref:hypothetical protein n=1 Tax=Roseivirga sp. BDSF3-8 TaxID=3241598 RepID=UPI0035327846
MSVRPASAKSGKKYFETFYVGAEGTQYFIKPLSLDSDESGEELLVDVTFRYKDEVRDSAIVNFSVIGREIYKAIESLRIMNDGVSISDTHPELIFNERKNDEFVSRFATKLPLGKVKELFENDEWQFQLYTDKGTITFEPTGKASKAINVLNEKVFVIM